MDFLMITAVLLCLWMIIRWVRHPRARALPPGPKGIPVLGNMLQMGVEDMHKTFDSWFKKYGPIVYCSVLNMEILVVSDADVLRKTFTNAQYTKITNDRPFSFLGKYLLWDFHGVVAGMNTSSLMKTRNVMRKGIQTIDYIAALREGGIQLMLDSLRKTGWKDFNPKSCFKKTVGNLLCGLLTGGQLSEEDEKLWWDAVDRLNDLVHPMIEGGLTNFPWMRHLPCKPGNIYRDVKRYRDRIVIRFHDEVKRSYRPGTTRGLMDIIFELEEEQKASGEIWMNDLEAKAVILDIVGAGSLTLYNGLLSSLLTLLNHPTVMKKMFSEMESRIGKSRLPCLEDRPKLPYCVAAVFECFRYTTFVNIILPHRVNKAIEIEGYHIPKESLILGSLWSMFHCEKTFPEPWTFQPERFLDNEGELLPSDNPTRQAFIPFSLGRRKCVGDQFAMGRMFLFLTSLVQAFDFLPPENGTLLSCDPRDYDMTGLVLHPKDYKCRAVPRNNFS